MTKRAVRGASGKFHCYSLSTLLEINLPRHQRCCSHDNLTVTLSRYKKRKGTTEDDFEEENDEDSTVFSDEEMEELPSDGEDEQDSSDSEDDEEVRVRTKPFPTIYMSWDWASSNDRPLDSFSCVDRRGLVYTNYWNGSRSLSWEARAALEDAQRSLVARQDRSSIALEYNSAHHLSQVPYREYRVLFCISKRFL